MKPRIGFLSSICLQFFSSSSTNQLSSRATSNRIFWFFPRPLSLPILLTWLVGWMLGWLAGWGTANTEWGIKEECFTSQLCMHWVKAAWCTYTHTPTHVHTVSWEGVKVGIRNRRTGRLWILRDRDTTVKISMLLHARLLLLVGWWWLKGSLLSWDSTLCGGRETPQWSYKT